MFCCGFCGTLRRYISEMVGAISLKLSHMIGSVGTWTLAVSNLRGLPQQNFGGKWFRGKISEPPRPIATKHKIGFYLGHVKNAQCNVKTLPNDVN